MSEKGWFSIDRDLFDHLTVRGDPYCRTAALIWLIGEAAWKPSRIMIGSDILTIQRGQVAHSLRYMARQWGWSEPKVRRFLTRLKTDAVIDAVTDAGVTVITLCNYERYQSVPQQTDAPNDAPNDAAATQDRRKVITINNLTTDSVPKGTASVEAIPSFECNSKNKDSGGDLFPEPHARPVYTDSLHELWGEGIPILCQLGMKNSAARSNVGRWLKVHDAASVLSAIQRARDLRVIEPVAWISRALVTPYAGRQAGPQEEWQRQQNETGAYLRGIRERKNGSFKNGFRDSAGLRDADARADSEIVAARSPDLRVVNIEGLPKLRG